MIRRKQLVGILFVTFLLQTLGTPLSQAGETRRYEGEVACPDGWRSGIEVNIAESKTYTVCTEITQADRDLQAQDVDFRARQDAAIAAATAESQAWNAANPGKQKCVQWGPIVHANGVSTASGGVCANPVEPGAGTTVPTQPADPVTAPETSTVTSGSGSTGAPDPAPSADPGVPTPSTPQEDYSRWGNGSPFTRVLPGQLSTEQCPSGFQAANGLVAAIGVGTFTECWSDKAWAAYRLGGNAWEQFKNSGGTYDATIELNRQAQLRELKLMAKAVAQKAADSTPGIQRCSTWSGYGESGEECAYSFVAPSASTTANGTDTVTAGVATGTAADTSTSLSSMDPYPTIAEGGEIPNTRIASEPGVSQAVWESDPAYLKFSCPAGSGKAISVDMNFTTTTTDDRRIAYCVKIWRTTDTRNTETVTASPPNSDTSTSAATQPSVGETATATTIQSSTDLTPVAPVLDVAVNAISVTGTSAELRQLVPNVTSNPDQATAISRVLTRVEGLSRSTSVRTLRLPSNSNVEESAVSLTPKICSATGSTVTFKRVGNCSIAYTLSDAEDNQFTTNVKVRFRGRQG